MIRTTALALAPATAAWCALLDVASRAQALPDAERAFALARGAVPVRARRRRWSVPAGAVIEVQAGVRRGAPLLEPAPGSVPGIDELRQGVAIYRVHAAGTLEGRVLEEGARVVVSRRRPTRGEWAVVAEGRSIRLCVVGGPGLSGVPEEGRLLGVVEAVINEGQRRRCA